MADITYRIALTSKALEAGPSFSVYYSTSSLCDEYTYATRINLTESGSEAFVELDENTTCVKLQSAGGCENYMVSGSQPETGSYNTHKITLTEKNNSGPEYVVSERTGSLFTFLDREEMATVNSTSYIEPDVNAVAIRLRSTGQCNNEKTVQIGGAPGPTPTPSPTPTPVPVTPTPTPEPTATPAPTPSNCFPIYTIYRSAYNETDACCVQENPTVTYLDTNSLATATIVYSDRDNNCSDVLSERTWFTQNFNEYYIWNGQNTLSGPFSCPGCP